MIDLDYEHARNMTDIWRRVYFTSFGATIVLFILAAVWHDRWLWWFAFVPLPLAFFAYFRKEHWYNEAWQLATTRAVGEVKAWWLGLEKDRVVKPDEGR